MFLLQEAILISVSKYTKTQYQCVPKPVILVICVNISLAINFLLENSKGRVIYVIYYCKIITGNIFPFNILSYVTLFSHMLHCLLFQSAMDSSWSAAFIATVLNLLRLTHHLYILSLGRGPPLIRVN